MAVVTLHDGKTFFNVNTTDEFAKEYEKLDDETRNLERRETRRHTSLDTLAEFIADQNSNTFEKAELFSLCEKLKVALSKLTQKQRAVVIMHAVFGMSFSEIGRKLKLHKDTVRECFYRSTKILKEFLQNTPSKRLCRG